MASNNETKRPNGTGKTIQSTWIWQFPEFAEHIQCDTFGQLLEMEKDINTLRARYDRCDFYQSSKEAIKIISIIHNAEAVLRMLDFEPAKLSSLKSEVIKKNQERDYYPKTLGINNES